MAKNLFQPGELKKKEGEFKLGLVHNFVVPEEEVEVEEVPEYTGPTIEDLQREADEYKARWEEQKQQMLEEAQSPADEIVNKAKEAAFAEVKRQSDEAQIIKNDAEQKAQEIIKLSNEIIGKYLSIENILLNQMIMENLMKDYKWNNPDLNSIKKNELIIKFNNLT